MIGAHQAAILLALAESEAQAVEAPTFDELVDVAAKASGRSPSSTRESCQGLKFGGSIERVPEDCRKDWDVARLRMTVLGRGDLARWQAKNP